MLLKLSQLSVFLLGSASAFAPMQKRSVASSALGMAEFSLDPETTAFVWIEYQNEFTTPGGKLHDAVKDCMEKTNSKSSLVPKSNRIFWCSDTILT